MLEYLWLVRRIAREVRKSLTVHIEIDDLIAAGTLGLFDAAERFDPKRGIKFATYAKFRIRGSILDSLRELDWASRDMRRRHKQVSSAMNELLQALERRPTESEIAAKLGVDVERWRRIVIDLRNVGLDLQSIGIISASTRPARYEELPAPDYEADESVQPQNIVARRQMRQALNRAMQRLPKRYQRVVQLYYDQAMTMEQIGMVLGVNESRVSQIHKAALGRMNTALRGRGITSASALT